MKILTYSALLSVVAAETVHSSSSSSVDLKYANYIFNAVHSSMRQWGSSLQHNGLTAFLATVPAGTELYHGTNTPYRINGTEWLAFEPEHALIFARTRGPGRGPNPPHDRDGSDDKNSDAKTSRKHRGASREERIQVGAKPDWGSQHHGQDKPPKGSGHRGSKKTKGSSGFFNSWKHSQSQEPLEPIQKNDDEPSEPSGYFHTYVTKHDLRLLYVDGQSAAKSDFGTLDLQDVVILDKDMSKFDEDKDKRPHGPMGEAVRALDLCRMAREDWGDKIDGTLRMEGGFEIILCSFEKDMDVLHISATKPRGDNGGPGGSPGSNLHYYKAIAARYDGIGGRRVRVNYDNFVSLFAYPESIYFDDESRPRAKNGTSALDQARADIDALLSSNSGTISIDWQAVADMVVDRYSDSLLYLTSGHMSSVEEIQFEVEQALRPFVDYERRNSTEELIRCSLQYFPKDLKIGSVASQSILNVTQTICSTLLDVAEATDLEAAVQGLEDLKDWLNWTSFKKCRGCAPNEVCQLPIWPMGSKEDFEKPQCRSEMSHRGNYWGEFGPPGSGGPHDDNGHKDL